MNNSDFIAINLRLYSVIFVIICILYDFEGINYNFDFLALQSIIMYFWSNFHCVKRDQFWYFPLSEIYTCGRRRYLMHDRNSLPRRIRYVVSFSIFPLINSFRYQNMNWLLHRKWENVLILFFFNLSHKFYSITYIMLYWSIKEYHKYYEWNIIIINKIIKWNHIGVKAKQNNLETKL